MDKLNPQDSMGASLVRSSAIIEAGKPFGRFSVNHLRVQPEFVAEGHKLVARLVRLGYSAQRREASRLESEILALPRFSLGQEEYANLVTDAGAKLMLDSIFNNTAAGAPFMGLKGTGTAVVADTQASHASWLEQGAANAPTYSGTRKTPAFSAASGSGAGNRQKATSAVVVFTFTGSGTVFGSFINVAGTSAIDNTTGTLFSAGDFSGSKAVVSTDVLNVTYTLNI